jgi:hypothetical protein
MSSPDLGNPNHGPRPIEPEASATTPSHTQEMPTGWWPTHDITHDLEDGQLADVAHYVAPKVIKTIGSEGTHPIAPSDLIGQYFVRRESRLTSTVVRATCVHPDVANAMLGLLMDTPEQR